MSITLVLFDAAGAGGFWPAGWRPDEGEMTFQHWRPGLQAFLLQIRARDVTVLLLSTIPTGIAGGGDI